MSMSCFLDAIGWQAPPRVLLCPLTIARPCLVSQAFAPTCDFPADVHAELPEQLLAKGVPCA